MERLRCLNADRKTIKKKFSSYGKVGELIGCNKDQLLHNLEDERILGELLNVESGNFSNLFFLILRFTMS
jgi:hypothetical protein